MIVLCVRSLIAIVFSLIVCQCTYIFKSNSIILYTSIVLLKVHSDVSVSMGKGKVPALHLLDKCVAFKWQ